MSKENEPLEVSLDLKTRPVSLKAKDKHGVIVPIKGELREMDGTARDEWMTFVSSKAKFGPDGKPTGAKDFKGVYSFLLVRTLFKDDGTPFNEKEINGWSSSAQEVLFKASTKLSGVDTEAEEDAKND